MFSFQSQLFNVRRKIVGRISEAGRCRGFQILRTGSGGNTLSVISPPATGYSVPFLRDTSGLGQALGYIRPLQRNLDTSVNAVV
jgi:hypothetical protein